MMDFVCSTVTGTKDQKKLQNVLTKREKNLGIGSKGSLQ